jgi:GNAT superfamily N-acetyltransferase
MIKKLESKLKQIISKHPLSTFEDYIDSRFVSVIPCYRIDYVFNHLSFKEYNGFVYLSYYHKDSSMVIKNISIDKKHQGNGYGKQLVHLVEDFAREFKCQNIIADFSVEDSFWEHMNYQKSGNTDYIKIL